MGTVTQGMSASILLTIKDMLGSTGPYDPVFDGELLTDINSAISILQEIIGAPIDETFEVTSDAETWTDLLGSDYSKFKLVKTFMHTEVKLMFDPPTSSVLLGHYKQLNEEARFYLKLKAEIK